MIRSGTFGCREAAVCLLVVWLLACLLGAGGAQADTAHELRIDPERLPYQADVLRASHLPATEAGNCAFAMCDVDGDGQAELLEGADFRVLAHDFEDDRTKIRWQINLDPAYRIQPRNEILGVARDRDGDGVEELYFTAVTDDPGHWRFLVLDPAREAIVLDVPLPVCADRVREPYWDGYYLALDYLEDADGQGRDAILLMRPVAYDAQPRGLLAVDPDTGEVIWEFVSGVQPHPSSLRVADLDADGTVEILFYTHAPNNLGGRLVNGFSDDRTYFLVLANTGELLWAQELGPKFFTGNLQAVDLDGDGVREIITYTFNGSNNHTNQLTVWDWPGRRVIASKRMLTHFDGLAVLPGPRPGTSRLVCGSNDGTVTRYLYTGSALETELRVLLPETRCRVAGSAELLPKAGPELVVDLDWGKRTLLMDADLEPLAQFADDQGWGDGTIEILSGPAGRQLLLRPYSRGLAMVEFQPAPPRRWPWRPALGVLAALGVTFFAGWQSARLRNRWRAAPAGVEIPAAREARFKLLRELEEVDHSVVGSAKGLQRLVWLLEAYGSDLGGSNELDQRIRLVLTDYRQTVHPRLFGILHQAEETEFDAVTVRETISALAALHGRIELLTQGPLLPAAVQAIRVDLRREWEQVRSGFLQLRAGLLEYFTTDVMGLIQGMVLVREVELQRSSVTFRLDGPAAAGPVRVLADSGDLRFVLGNLLDNAVRALAEVPERRLQVTVRCEDEGIFIRIADSGPGIPAELRSRLFRGRASSRVGGGLGLMRSQEILARWSGTVSLEDTPPGQGATFVVQLLAAPEPAAEKSLRARA